MEGEKILLSQRQLQRWHLMKMVEVGKITLKEAGERIGVCYRQAKRIRRVLREKGIRGLIHGNTGQPSHHRLSEVLRQRVLRLSREVYPDFNDTHFTEKLEEEEGMVLSRETVRQIRRGGRIEPKRRRRAKKHRRRRERMSQEGWMVLWDGSPHLWFGEGYPPCCLMAAMDDATGRVLAARFFPFEGTSGYFWLLKQIVKHYGVPVSIYQDRHGTLHRNDDHWSLEEQLAGRQDPTQVGLALEALGIQPIFALSPQAKGRMERLFGILQDRLIAELRLAGITTMAEANVFLKSFIKRFNRRFAIHPRESQKAWRTVPERLNLDRIISLRYRTVVGNDNTARLGGLIMDIPPGPHRRSYAREKVEVRQLLDGSWRVYHRDQLIAKHPSTSLNDPVKALRRRKYPARGAKDYSWVYLTSAPSANGNQLIQGTP